MQIAMGMASVNFADTVAINQNYGLTHTFSRGSGQNGHIPLFLTTTTPLFFPGDTVTFEVHLGNMDSMANDIYGIGFVVGYDTSQIEPEMLWVDYSDSWLGDKNQDMITIDKDFFQHGRVEMALTRINHMDRNGHGKIADLIVVIDDDLYKRNMPFELTILESFAWNDQADEIELDNQGAVFTIEDPSTSLSDDFIQGLKIYPQPAEGSLYIDHASSKLIHAQLFNLTGQVVPSSLSHSPTHALLSFANLPSGFYLLELEFETGKAVKKIMIK